MTKSRNSSRRRTQALLQVIKGCTRNTWPFTPVSFPNLKNSCSSSINSNLRKPKNKPKSSDTSEKVKISKMSLPTVSCTEETQKIAKLILSAKTASHTRNKTSKRDPSLRGGPTTSKSSSISQTKKAFRVVACRTSRKSQRNQGIQTRITHAQYFLLHCNWCRTSTLFWLIIIGQRLQLIAGKVPRMAMEPKSKWTLKVGKKDLLRMRLKAISNSPMTISSGCPNCTPTPNRNSSLVSG